MTFFEGKALIASVATLTIVLVGGAILSTGSYVSALPLVMVPTAHAAFAFFWVAFSASSLHRLRPTPYSLWAMKNRRYIGLSFAFIHTVHLLLVLSNISMTDAERPILILLAGALAYVFLFLMALTSNNISVKKMGSRNWRRLHQIGSWYIWIIFISALPEVLQGKYNRIWIFTLCVTVLILRIMAHVRKKAKVSQVA